MAEEREKGARRNGLGEREGIWDLPFVVLGGTVPFLKPFLLSWLGDQP